MRTRTNQHAFTLIELLVVIAVIAVLMAIMMPALQRVKKQAQEMVCIANLRQYGIAQHMYLDDSDDRYPSAWTSLVSNEHPYSGYERYCRWHDPRYPADGPFWPYLKEGKVHLCPTFNSVARSEGSRHPSHDPSIPMDPYYSYSMNAFLGVSPGSAGATRRSGVTRSHDEVFFFAEENMWTRPGCPNVLNDNALCGDGRDWFGTFHGAKGGNWNEGNANAVFVDAHVEEVRSALREENGQAVYVDEEYRNYEKYSWPLKKAP